MKVLLADDSPSVVHVVETALDQWGYKPVIARDGGEALGLVKGADPPPVMILDWMMPNVTGLELCRLVRRMDWVVKPHIILMTAKQGTESLLEGFKAGASEFLQKPFEIEELQARVRVGASVVELQSNLARRVQELERLLAKVQRLEGMLPICCYCKKIRDDNDYWQQVETYISIRTQVEFTHGICPECSARSNRAPAENPVPRG